MLRFFFMLDFYSCSTVYFPIFLSLPPLPHLLVLPLALALAFSLALTLAFALAQDLAHALAIALAPGPCPFTPRPWVLAPHPLPAPPSLRPHSRYLLLRISVTASEELKTGKSELQKMGAVLQNVDAVANAFADSLKHVGSLKQIAEDVKTLRYFLNNLAGVAG